jgi:tetratricopeptide (TPR) repeat protein
LEKGDVAFRRGNYAMAWEAYHEAGDPAEDDELAARIARTRWFLIEDRIRELLATWQVQAALDLIPQVIEQAPPDRLPELTEFQRRASKQLGMLHAQLGYELLEAGEVDAALRELTIAVAWNPLDETSSTLLQRTADRLEREGRLGESFYFEGMENVRNGFDLRARASFHHAAGLLGEDSRAQERYEGMTQDMAATSRAEAGAYLEAGLLGPAYLSLRTAERLDPESAETAALAELLDTKVRSAQALIGADISIRGGRPDNAAEYLEEIKAGGVEAYAQQARTLEERNVELVLDQDYKRARAYELDEQVQRAAVLYQEIVERTQGFSWADTALRLSNLEGRLKNAAKSYAAALEAQAAGNQNLYRERLEETVRFASDYEDALLRLAQVRALQP